MQTPLVPIAMAALLLTGCGSGTSSQTAAPATPGLTTTSATPSPEPTATSAVDSQEDQVQDLYLDSIRDEQPALMEESDEDLVTMGQGFCDMYDGGAVGADIHDFILSVADADINDFMLLEAGAAFTVHELVAVHEAAVGAYCPQHTDKMGQQVGAT
jgi:hypothetical protein